MRDVTRFRSRAKEVFVLYYIITTSQQFSVNQFDFNWKQIQSVLCFLREHSNAANGRY